MAGGTLKLNLGVKGNYDNPKVSLLGAETGAASGGAKEQLKATVKAEKEKLAEQAKTVVDEKKKQAKQMIDSLAAGKKPDIKKEVKKEVDKAKDRLKKLFK